MVFSSIIFIFLFLPITIVIYLISGKKLRNLFLLLASILFYAWGEAYYVIIMLISTLLNYVLGVLLGGRVEKDKDGKLLLIISICLNLGMLIFYKYSNFLANNLNYILTVLGINFNIYLQPIHLPIGISFYTFHSISYIIDIYKKKAKAQKNIFNLALYISFFPQLVAGPIIKYHDIVDQLENRKMSFEKFSYGIERFIFGLGKKLIIADTMGSIADKIFALKSMDLTTGLAFVLAPNKLSLYSEYAPANLLKGDNSRYDQLVSFLKQNSDIEVLDLKNTLLKNKIDNNLYYKTDSHWNELGAYYGYKAIVTEIKEDYPLVNPLDLNSFTINKIKEKGGDLAYYLGVRNNVLKEEEVRLSPKINLKSSYKKDDSMTWVGKENNTFSTTLSNTNLPKAIVFRDSYTTNMMPYLSENFSKIVYNQEWNFKFNKTLVSTEKPDVVLYIMVERNLDKLLEK